MKQGVEAAYLGHTSVRSRLDRPTKTTINKNYIEKIGLQFETADYIRNVMSFCWSKKKNLNRVS